MSKTGRGARASALLAMAASSPSWAYTSAKWNLPEGVSELSHELNHLHMMMFWVCVVIGLIVFGAMFYSVFAHRKSKGARPADFHESTLVEVLWTAVPFVILIALAIPAAATLVKMDDTGDADLDVIVTGYQWKWGYEYRGTGVSFFSTLAPASNQARQLRSGIDPYTVPNYIVDVDNPLVLPVGRKVRFLITSKDVIHAWWVSEIAVKKDAIPGYINEMWTRIEKPGEYRGVCAELCGRDHAFMPIVVKAVPADEFDAWLAERKASGARTAAADPQTADTASDAAVGNSVSAPASPQVVAAAAGQAAAGAAAVSKEELVAKGEKVYQANCMACHQADGSGMPPTFPTLHASPIANGPAAAQIEQILKGKGMMPPFPQLSDEDIAAVATYERVSWGNTGSVVQPAEVTALRK